MTRRSEKAKAKVEKNKAANKAASDKDKADKEALVEKVNKPGGAGRLSKKEIELARRMGDGEGQKRKP